MDFNLAYDGENISEDSGPVTEPVTLQEVKDYLRLEGFAGDSSSGLVMQTPISLSFTSGTSVQSALLQVAGVVVAQVIREGITYSPTTGTPGARQYVFDGTAGTVTFLIASNGSETVDIQYGISGAAGTVDDFDFDDSLLETMIQAAREWCEAKTGCSLVFKRMRVPVTNLSGGISLPYGPVIGTVTAVDCEGDEIDSSDIKLIGTKFPSLRLPKKANMVLTYDAGYNILTCPGGLKDAIKAHVAAVYENRGDEGKADFSLASKLCGPYIKSGMFG